MTPGGKRKGAGRRPNPAKKRPICLRIGPEYHAYLATCESKVGTVETALRESPGFKHWNDCGNAAKLNRSKS